MKYYCPTTVSELNQLLQNDSILDSSKFLSGGTDILPRWEHPDHLPEHLIDLKKIDTLSGISEGETHVSIGALTTVETLRKNEIINKYFQSISQAASQFAGVQIRHRATIGGNICNASPAGDLLPCLYAHHAEVEIRHSSGVKKVPINTFITGPGQTSLKSGEIVSKVTLNKTNSNSLFYKLGLRQSMAISVINFSMVYDLEEDSTFKSLTAACGAVAPTVVYLDEFSKSILNNTPIKEALETIDTLIAPIDDIRASASYRRTALKNVLSYFVTSISTKNT